MTKTPATFTKTEYYTIVWVLFTIALAFFISRIWIRLKVYGHLKIDDGLIILAMLCLLAGDIASQTWAPLTYIEQDVQSFHLPKPANYETIADEYAKHQWAVAYLFFTAIWAVKGSFLAFYDSLTQRLTFWRRAWWMIVVLTILTYIGSLFAYAFLDGLHIKSNLRNKAIIYQFSADVVTDILITMIPISLALKSHVPTKQKLTLVSIFSLTLIITIFSIVRFVLNSPGRSNSSPSWIQIWSTVEQSVSVIVACLASFRTWVIANNRSADRANERSHSHEHLANTSPRRNRIKTDNFGLFRSNRSEERTEESIDIELLDPRALAAPTARAIFKEPAAVAFTPIRAKGSDSV